MPAIRLHIGDRVNVRARFFPGGWRLATIVPDPPVDVLERPRWAAARVHPDGWPCDYWIPGLDLFPATLKG